MRVKEIVVILLALLIFQGIVYGVYDRLRDWCVDMARNREFSSGLAFVLTIAVCLGIWGAALVALIVVAIVPILNVLAALLLIPVGLAGWVKMWKNARIEDLQRRQILATCPAPQLQFRIQDLWAGAFVFGLVMMTLTHYALQANNPAANSVLAAIAVVIEISAFLIAMDISRHSPFLKAFFPRACYTALIMALAAIPPLFLIIVMSWKAWRYALWKGRVAR